MSNVGHVAGEWIEIKLTADSGACESVMPRDGPCIGIPILPSYQSRNGIDYEVANSATIPCLGERHLEIWTEGATAPRMMAIQVADVHKPLLSLSACADVGYESRLGKYFGYLLDSMTSDTIPLEREGNLYTLRAWVRAAPVNLREPQSSVANSGVSPAPPFGGQR